MKRRRLQWNVIPDEGGQALTEFVIVIPVMLLFFFSMLQYFAIVQSTQLGNYAAFVAARVYAVSESCDTNAASEAETAACIALAPVSRPVPNELGGNTGIGSDINQVETWIGTVGGTFGQDLYDFASGYVMNQYVRFNGDVLGGGVSCVMTNYNSGPQQVDVTINYPQPIFLPGLQSLWTFLGGSNMYASLSSQSAGLTGVPKYLLPIYAGNSSYLSDVSELSQYDSSLGSTIQGLVSDIPVVLLPYIDIQSECAMGVSPWSGTPRMPDSIANDTSSTNNSGADLLNKTQSDKTVYSNVVEQATLACQNETNAYNAVVLAQQQYESNPTNTTYQSDLTQAKQTYSNFYYSNITAQANVTGPENTLNGDINQLPSINGHSMQDVGGVSCPSCPDPGSLSP